jgi:hypothetical protein
MFALQKCSPDRTVSERLLGELLDVVISRATYGPVVGGFPVLAKLDPANPEAIH